MFLLYSTLGCHLCDDAALIIEPVLSHYQFEWQRFDIAEPNSQFTDKTAEMLVAEFGEKIPVLAVDFSQQYLAWPFDQEAVVQFIQALIAEAQQLED